MFARTLLKQVRRQLVVSHSRLFCSSSDLVIKTSTRMSKTLNNEIQYETENYQYDASVDESLAQNNFTLE